MKTFLRLLAHPSWAVCSLALLAGFEARAATRTWDGGGADNNWTTAANWDAAVAAGDDLVFPGGAGVDATSLNNTNNFAANTAYSSITISGTNYILRGNAIILTNGISHASGGANTLILNIQLNAPQTFASTIAAGTLIVNGNINLNGQNLTNSTTGRINLAGLISGAGNLIKSGSGTLGLIGGASGNVYAGSMTVNDGVLELSKSGVAITGALNIGDGIGAVDSAVVRLLVGEQIASSAAVSIQEDGLLDLAGLDDVIGTLTLTGGDVATGGGLLTLGGTLTGTSTAANPAIISGFLDLGATPRTFDIANGPILPDLDIVAVISGTVTLTKTGDGELGFNAANNYTGLTILAQGNSFLSDENALGTPAAGTVVSNGAGLFLQSNTHIGGEALTLNGNAGTSGALHSFAGSNSWAGNITLASDSSVTVTTNDFLNLTGAISGSGGLIKDFPGTLIFSGVSANTYAGTTTVNQGTLWLNKSGVSMPTAIPGALVIGDGFGPADSAAVRLLAANQISDSAGVTMEADGLLDLNSQDDTLGALTFNGGDIKTGTGTLFMGGDATVNVNTNSQALISGKLSVAVTRTFDGIGHYFSPDMRITAAISGSGGLIKSGVGELQLAGSNSYSGLTTVNAGGLIVTDDNALGTTTTGTTVNGTAVLALLSTTHVGDEPLTLNGVGRTNSIPVSGALNSVNGSNSWAGPITLTTNATVSVRTNDFLNLSGPISGTGGITKYQAGTLIFSGLSANTYAGTTTVNEGTLLLTKSAGTNAVVGPLVIGNGVGGANADVVRLQAHSQIADSSPITITNSGLLDSDGFAETVGALSGAGNLQLDSSTFAVGFFDSTVPFNGAISGSGNLSRNGTGTWILNGSNTFSGNFSISGTVFVNGFMPANVAAVTGTLGGTGTLGRVNLGGGTISPGLSPGRLNISNLTFSAASIFRVELNGTAPGSGHDQLNVNGSVNFLSATLNATLGFLSAISNSFTIIDNDGVEAVMSTFLGLPEGATLNVSGTPFVISYIGGTGNDVVLTQLAPTQQPLLNIQPSGNTNVVLSWATNFTGFTLEGNTNLSTNVWSVVTNAPAVSGTNNVVTNAAIGSGKFYRLRAP